MPWPGNKRQLVGVLRSLMALGLPGSTLTVVDLPIELQRQQTMAPSPRADAQADDLHAIELRAIDEAVATCGGNVAAAARKLGISRSTIYRRKGDSPAKG